MTDSVERPAGTGSCREGRVSVADGVSLAVFVWEPNSSAPAGADATPFVLLHGVASSARTWDGVARHLAAAGHPVYAVDFRGHGRSDGPEAGYDLATCAADLAAAVERLGLSRPILVGHSLGAMVILEAVTRRPELGQGVALVEGGLVDASVQFATLEECLAKLKLPPVGGMPAARVETYLRGANPGWSEERLAGAMAGFEAQADGTVQWRLTPPRLESLVRSMWAQHVSELWPSVPVPALVVAADTGDATWTGQKRGSAAAAERAIPTARVEWFTADHAIHADRPTEVTALFLDALTGLWA